MPFPNQFISFIDLGDLKNGNTIFLINDEIVVLKGTLNIPIKDSHHFFSWHIWISVSKSEFLKNIDPITRNPIDDQFIYQGKLESKLLFYDDVEGCDMGCRLIDSVGESLPIIEVQGQGELKDDQVNGISMEKVTMWMKKIYSKRTV